MAIDVLSIPGNSAEDERVFSMAGRLYSDDRNRLGDDTVDSILVQAHGLQTGLF
jgi:hypothetical protein